jgi:hypothetical protein
MIKPQDKRRFLFSDATGEHFLVCQGALKTCQGWAR